MSDSHVWRTIHPEGWAPPIGYSNAVVTEGGRHIHMAGQIAMQPDGSVAHRGDLVAQARLAFSNVLAVLAAAGGQPMHLTRMRLYVCSAADYRANAKEIGRTYRALFGRWFPAMTLVEVSRLFEPDALIEVECDAVIPE